MENKTPTHANAVPKLLKPHPLLALTPLYELAALFADPPFIDFIDARICSSDGSVGMGVNH